MMTHFCTMNMRTILNMMIAKTELITNTIRKQTKAPGINLKEIRYNSYVTIRHGYWILDITCEHMPSKSRPSRHKRLSTPTHRVDSGRLHCCLK